MQDSNDNYDDKDTVTSLRRPYLARKKSQYKAQDVPVLGIGTFGTVIRATWQPPSSSSDIKGVALKITSKDPPNSEKDPDKNIRAGERKPTTGEKRKAKTKEEQKRKARELRVHNEIRILKKVKHENIIHFYDSFETNRNFYISTEIVHSESLSQRLQRFKHFEEPRTKNIMTSILQGVKYLHERGIVHADLNLENIMFRKITSDSELVIIGFSFARDADSPKRLDDITRGKYTEPHIIRALEENKRVEYGEKTDTWSTGVIVHKLLTGVYPFASDDDDEELYYKNVLKKKIDYKAWYWENVSIPAREFTRSLLRRMRSKRSSAADALNHEWFKAEQPEDRDLAGLRRSSESQRRNAIRAGVPALAEASGAVQEATTATSSRPRRVHIWGNEHGKERNGIP